MSYTKTNWQNTITPVNQTNMNKIENQLESLSTKIDSTTDYIIEQGSSGIWEYRKWNSGTVDLWGTYTATLSHYTTVFGGYGYYTTVPLPFTVYSPVITYAVKVASGFAIPASALGYAGSSSLSSFNVYAISNVSGSQSTAWVCNVKGRWE